MDELIKKFDVLKKFIDYANKYYNGHFTVLKFTTDWACCFGTLRVNEGNIPFMSHGKSIWDAMEMCLNDTNDAYYIETAAPSEDEFFENICKEGRVSNDQSKV